jgi:hypothetical protein
MQPFRGILNIASTAAFWIGVWAVFYVLGFGLVGLAAPALWVALVFPGSRSRYAGIQGRIGQTLMPGENLIVQAVQLRAFALWSRRKVVGITNSRIIAISRGIVGGFTMQDIQWKDLQQAEMCENVMPGLCGSTLIFSYRKRDLGSVARRRDSATGLSELPVIEANGIPCEQAELMYSRAQAEEQAWEEKRRVRGIEETRAAAGGVYLSTASGTPAETTKREAENLVEQLTKLAKLRESGAISDTEFETMKAHIIARA